MSDKLITATVTVVLAIIGVAVIAMLVSGKSDTGGVLSAGGKGFSQMLCAALSPLGINCGVPSVTSSISFN